MDVENMINQLESMPYGNEKGELTDELFHISFWRMMNTKQKVRVIQLLENNLSFAEGREPSDIFMPYSMPHLATSSYLTRKIKVSQRHLESCDEMNTEIYCAIVHEHEHMSQFAIADDNERTDEQAEIIRSNLFKMIPYRGNTVTEYVEYRLQPIEYSAHYVSEATTKNVFEKLEKKFGQDVGFKKWSSNIVSTDLLVRLYNEENRTNNSFEEIYQGLVERICGSNNLSNDKLK